MSNEIADAAIDLVARDVEDLSNPLCAAIIDCGDAFATSCNTLSLRVARRLVDGDLTFEAADNVMNWVWSYMVGRASDIGESTMPEPAYSIYDAIDAGEYEHSSDGPQVDPVQKYTIPGLKQILARAIQLDVVRGERPLDALAELGVSLSFGEDKFQADVPHGLNVEVPLADLAHGLLNVHTRGTELHRWAFTVLALDVDFEGIDSTDGQALLEAIGSASAGEAVTPQALELAHRLAG